MFNNVTRRAVDLRSQGKPIALENITNNIDSLHTKLKPQPSARLAANAQWSLVSSHTSFYWTEVQGLG